MTMQEYCIIDDIDDSLSHASSLGRSVLSASIRDIQTSVLSFAARRGWTVVRYSTFVDWAYEGLANDERTWFVLDPMFPISKLPHRLRRLRLTRLLGTQDKIVFNSEPDLAGIAASAGVIDDAAASGRTMLYALDLLRKRGVAIDRAMICCAMKSARDATRLAMGGIQWREYLPGDYRMIHLRDGCPYLPFSARLADHAALYDAGGQRMEARVAPTDIPGSLWQVLWLDRAVRTSIERAHGDIALRFEAAIGRTPRISDLSLLGERVPALVRPGQSITSDSPLLSLA